MAQQTHWTERNAARNAYLVMPGMYRGKRHFEMFPYGPEPKDFDRRGQYYWFYSGWYIIWLSIIVAAVAIILDLILYAHPDPERKPDVRCLILSVVPAGIVVVWMSIDGFLRKKMWPRGRLCVEGVVVIGTIVCLGMLGALARVKASQGDSFADWYAGLSGVLGGLLLLRLLRLGELYYALRHPE